MPVCVEQMFGGYADFMYQTGMVDENQRDYVQRQSDLAIKYIQQQKWIDAFDVCIGTIVFWQCTESVPSHKITLVFGIGISVPG